MSAAAHSPGHVLVHPATPSDSTASDVSIDTTLSLSDPADFSSSDDEAGVFFGAHKPFESKIVSALSKSIPSSPATHDLSRAAGPRRSSLINRVRKRDSREFLRRKTLLLPGTPQADKAWEGGFYERDAQVEAGPSSGSPTVLDSEDVVADFDSLHLDSFTSSLSSGGETLSTAASDDESTGDDEHDKENIEEPEVYLEQEQEEEYVPPPRESVPISVGFNIEQFGEQGGFCHLTQLTIDLALPLDMGGLSMFDIDDPEVSIAEQGNEAQGVVGLHDNLVDITYHDVPEEPFDLVAASLSPNGRTSDPFDSPFFSRPPVLSSARDVSTPGQNLIAFSSPLAPMATASATAADMSDMSFASDMNSPVGRAPAVIPRWTSPTKLASPMTALSDGLFSDDFGFPEDVAVAAVALPSLESPPQRVSQPPSQTPARTVTTTPRSTGRAGSAVTPQVKRDFDALLSLSQRPLPTPQPSLSEPPPSAQQLKVSQRADARSQKARGQLDAIYSGSRFTGITAPSRNALASSNNAPTRTVSSSSSSLARPTSSSAAKAAVRPVAAATMQARKPAVPKRTLAGTTAKVGPKAQVARQATKPATTEPRRIAGSASKLHAPRPMHAKGALPGSVQPHPSGLPRPASRRPAAQPTAANIVKVVEPSVKVHVPRPATEPIAPSLKRPFSATQSLPARSASAVGAPSRPALGLPTRPARDLPSASLGSSTTGFPHAPTRSPRASARSPAKALLGKPTRGATTPTPLRVFTASQRGQPTPQRPLGSPTRQKPLTTTTPSRSPLGVLRPLAVSTNRIPSPTKPSADFPLKSKLSTKAVDVCVNRGVVEEASPVAEEHTETSPLMESAPSNDEESAQPTANEATSETHNSPAPQPPRACTPPPSEPERRTSPRVSPKKHDTTASPDKDARRSKRSTRTPARLTEEPAAPPRVAKPAVPSIVPGMSEKELKAATQRNTIRNQVYLCSIDRQIIRVDGPRPPSPTSKIRTTAEKEEQDRKAGRGARAKRRQRSSEGMGSSDEDEDAVVEVEEVNRAPGDEADYRTPKRPAKRAKLDEGRFVRWNRALTVIRGGLGEAPPPKSPTPAKSAVRDEARYPLDSDGNAKERPVERLKRTTVVVRAVFYDGEEPAPFDYGPPKGKRRS